MSSEVKKIVESCVTCKEHQRVRRKKFGNEGLVNISYLEPMESVSMDLGYLGISKPFLVLIDKFSGYKAVWELRDSKSLSIIKALTEFFYSMWLRVQIRSDGGPCFSAREFAKFCMESGIYHSKSAPGHHQSNGGGRVWG